MIYLTKSFHNRMEQEDAGFIVDGRKEWEGLTGRLQKEEINVQDFTQNNYKSYDGDEFFLAEPTEAANKLWQELQKLQKEERAKDGVLDMETEIISSLTSYGPGCIKGELKDLEAVVSLQTDKSLKCAFMSYGGIKMSEETCTTYGYEPGEKPHKVFRKYHKTHNDAVFDCYAPEMCLARRNKIATGLPDTYGCGWIVGDYRRVALYGIDYLIKQKQKDKTSCSHGMMNDNTIRQCEELAGQIKALRGMKAMAALYGFNISGPTTTAKKAVQQLYSGYLATIKTQNDVAMSIGRVSTFLDIYIERNLEAGIPTESEAQELIDHMMMEFRMVRLARVPPYNQLFFGDPVRAVLDLAGLGANGRHMVAKSDSRSPHTLENMGPASEPGPAVLCFSHLPESFKIYSARISTETSSVQYKNDDVMRLVWGDDYAVCCCVSATQTGREIQLFGICANPAKCLLYAINGGVGEKTKAQVGPEYRPIIGEYLGYGEVMHEYDNMMERLTDLYVNILNLIQYAYDRYYYESFLMVLIDTDMHRIFAASIAGFSHVVDFLTAIKHIKVKTVRDEDGPAIDYEIEGDSPCYRNDDNRADDVTVWLLKTFMGKVGRHHTYRDSEPTTSILVITSSVIYDKVTGTLPDGRKAEEPLPPGANPSYGVEQNSLLASLNSMTKLSYEYTLNDISNTQTISSDALGRNEDGHADNLAHVLDDYSGQGAHHLNVNVFGIEKLHDTIEHPEEKEYTNPTIRVSGYVVKFINLTCEQQLDVIPRTCHASL